jgi:hypothetical protein
LASQLPLLRYDPFDVTARFDKPYYMAYGTRGYSPDLLRRFFEDVRTPAGDKQLRVMEAAHFDMYWQPRFVDPIVSDVSTFFSRYLG